MALADISDIEDLLGSSISGAQEDKVQAYLDLVSDFIIKYVGTDFALHTDAVLKVRADGKGIIEIDNLDSVSLVEQRDGFTGLYSDVTSVIYYAYNSGLYGCDYNYVGYGFDGISQIYGLMPRRSYRVTCTYGWTSVPSDIKDVVSLLVLAGAGLDYEAINGLKSYRVGDVEEAYGISANENGRPVVTLNTLMSAVLDNYRTTAVTYRI